MAFSNGDGSFTEITRYVSTPVGWGWMPMADFLGGDFDGDGRFDVMVTDI
ncbi:FG-GAP repeat domain-containing protein [Kribbella deserti]|uniref:FG-GAP repeat domain-containing protein n=1 Tax=Kribbella deserti TaxID=1926257 RepID=A0ABV6QQQ0_9ACTN